MCNDFWEEIRYFLHINIKVTIWHLDLMLLRRKWKYPQRLEAGGKNLMKDLVWIPEESAFNYIVRSLFKMSLQISRNKILFSPNTFCQIYRCIEDSEYFHPLYYTIIILM